MGEKKRKTAMMGGHARSTFSGNPGMVQLPVAVKELKTVVVLWRHVVAAGDLAKAAELRTALTQWLLRVTACDPQSAQQMRIKAEFLGKTLPELGFIFDGPVQALVDAALAFDAARFRPAGPR